MDIGLPIGADKVSAHRQSSVTESNSRTQGISVAAKVVGGVWGVLSLGDRTECGENAYTTGKSNKFGTRKSVLCAPRRPKYNHSRKGALIQREPDKMPNQAWNGDRPGLDQAQTEDKPGLDQGLVRAQAGPNSGAAYHGRGPPKVVK